ncbi:MAG: STAS domain-containing protein [Oscillospiraceae bacterium]|nr:STAS domain-containing protein [Oscillospiraceae bacterium]
MEKSSFTVTTSSEAPNVELEVGGYIAYDTAGQFEKAINDSLESCPETVTVNMENVVVFTSVGIKIILKAFKNAKAKGTGFQIENPSEVVKNVLKLSDLTELLLK